MRKSAHVQAVTTHLTVAKKAYVCSDCIREGTHDIWILERPRHISNDDWLAMSNQVDVHKEESHGDK